MKQIEFKCNGYKHPVTGKRTFGYGHREISTTCASTKGIRKYCTACGEESQKEWNKVRSKKYRRTKNAKPKNTYSGYDYSDYSGGLDHV